MRRSILVWRLVHGRLPTMDLCCKNGFIGPNVCVVCCASEENIDHVFSMCPVVRPVWSWFFNLFGLHDNDFVSINALIVFCMGRIFGSQLMLLWRLGVVSILWSIWFHRNAVIFDGKKPTHFAIVSMVRSFLLESKGCDGNLGVMHNTVKELLTLHGLGIAPRIRGCRDPIIVHWRPPPSGWTKINTDGAAAGSPGALTCGGIFRNCRGFVSLCFHVKLGSGFAFEGELVAAIFALEMAQARELNFVWLESDSSYVVGLLRERTERVPWRVKVCWQWILRFISRIHFRVSHIFREGNKVADILAAPARESGVWFAPLSCIEAQVGLDFYGTGFFRFDI